MESGTWTRAPFNFDACATTSKALSEQSEKRGFPNASPCDSNRDDEPRSGAKAGPSWLCRGGRRRHRLTGFLDLLLVLVCARESARAGLLQLLRSRQALRHELALGCLRHRDAAPGRAPGHRTGPRTIHRPALLSPPLLHPPDRPARLALL